MKDWATRKVSFLVVVDGDQPDELAQLLGVPVEEVEVWRPPPGAQPRPESDPRPAPHLSWEIKRQASNDVPLDDVIEEVIALVGPYKAQIQRARAAAQVTTILRIVQYMEKDALVGPGFGFDLEVMSFLVDVGAFIDIDQYRS